MMNDEDFGSDSSDDEDYVPTQGPVGSEEESDGVVSSDDETPNDETKPKKSKNKTVPKKKTVSKKKGNPLLLAQQSSENVEETLEDNDLDNVVKDDTERIDNLWSDFMADTGTAKKPEPVKAKPKAKSWAEILGKKKSNSKPNSNTNAQSNEKSDSAVKDFFKTDELPGKPDTVKVTKVFEFAGEEVRVEEEVSADSKEAALLQPKPGSKRGLESVLSSLNKKNKLSTLQKTELDWKRYKQDSGLGDELALHRKSKDTYLEKQEFLQRADVRQFEMERDVRLKSRKGT